MVGVAWHRGEWARVAAPPFAYAALVWMVRPLQHRTTRPIPKLRVSYNVLMSTYSFLVAAMVFLKLMHNRRLDSAHELLCRASPGIPVGWYESKVLEWTDTLFILLRGRWPSSLHLRHHATAASVVALNIVGRKAPTPLFDVGTLLNAAVRTRFRVYSLASQCLSPWQVHAGMYAYYANPTGLARFRRAITAAQIVQHVLMVVAILAALAAPTDACDAPTVPYLVSLLMFSVWVAEFVHFYLTDTTGTRAKVE